MKVSATVLAALLATPSALAPHQDPVLVEHHAYFMGTRVSVAIWDQTRHDGLARLGCALAAIEQTEAELSTWRADSEISALNRAPVGQPWRLAPPTCAMFETVSEWQRSSDAAFDPAIGRLLEAWDIHGEGRVPSATALAAARASSGFAHLKFNRPGCTMTRTRDVAIDVGAFGKGEALDRAARAIGNARWMIDFGGQVSVHGVPPGMTGWPVAIADPLDRSRPRVEVTMREGSLSTSAGSERDLTSNGRRIGHHLDPRTGAPAAFPGSVTVWHPSALVADILSTALFVMGPNEGLAWAESRKLCACYLVPDVQGRLRVVATTAFRDSVLFSVVQPSRP